jgi:hypothetical protein
MLYRSTADMPKTKSPPATVRDRRATGELRNVTVWMELKLWQDLRIYAIRHDTSLTALVTECVHKHLSPLVNGGRSS